MTLNVDKTLHKAKALIRRGDPGAAAQLYRDILKRFPQNRQAIKGLAALGQAGTPAPPREKMLSAVQLYQAGNLAQALAEGRQLAAEYPADPMIHNFVGVVNSTLGNIEAAIRCYGKAIELKPDYTEVYCNLGVAFRQIHRTQDAIAHFLKATELEPGNPSAYHGLGDALKEAGRNEEAISSYRKAIGLNPDHAAVHNNLGNTLMYLGREEEAVPNFLKSIQLNPGNAEAHCNLGHAYNELRRYDEAIASYTTALQYKPGYDEARSKLIHLQAMLCNWDATQADTETIATLGMSGEVVSPFAMLALEDQPGRQLQRTQRYTREKFQHYQQLPPIPRPDVKPDRIRIGYFSADFYDHATMILMVKMFELHDSSKFSIHAFSFGPNTKDRAANRLKEAVEAFHDVRHLGEKEIAELARAEGIDIAVDLKCHTKQGRPGVFACRAAPVQMNYLGYPGTSGIQAMDYIVADHTLIPEDQRENYSEQVIYLPDSYQVNDCEREISDKAIARADAGLPETGFVFCCFNNSYKISSNEFDIWMRLLQQVDGSVLWLLSFSEQAGVNLRREAQQRNVDPRRIILAEKMPHAEHLARHRLADLFLDTFNYNAHTTASDALWGGLPIVTRLGQSFAARVAGSLLHAVGLPDLITNSAAEYEELALELAQSPKRLEELRNRLAINRLSHPLFDTKRFTHNIERAYQQAYQRYLNGREPATLFIQPDPQE